MNFRKLNIFSFLLVVSVFAAVMRLVDLASFAPQKSVAESAKDAHGMEKVAAADAAAPAVEKPAEKAEDPAAETRPPEESLKEAGKSAEEKPAEEGATAHTPPPLTSPYGEQGFSASEVEVLQSLAKRRDELEKREQALGQREALLKAASGEVDRKIAELNKIKGELEDLLNKQKTGEDERITSLVKIYENMKPKEAARIFDTLEMSVLLPVLGKMSERKTSPILASMNPEKAKEVTIKLAEQRKLPEIGKDKAAADVKKP